VFFGFGDRPTVASSTAAFILEKGLLVEPSLKAATEMLQHELELVGTTELSPQSQLYIAKTMLKRVIGDLQGRTNA
jgi:hypothetical protein